MSVRYQCTHLDDPRPSASPIHPSSWANHHPLTSLYFCEECDAIRCDLCVAVEVASYFCPNCLFDVPSANVRGDRNRNCFACPSCDSSLSVQASAAPTATAAVLSSTRRGSSEPEPKAGESSTARYHLICAGCKWSSQEIGWIFDKPTGLAQQVQRIHAQTERVQSEFEALKDHLDSYITSTAPVQAKKPVPTRHISHLTQMAAKALHRDVPGMNAVSARPKPKQDARDKWDDMGVYESKNKAKDVSGEIMEEDARDLERNVDRAALERVWCNSWSGSRAARSVVPQRILLQTKLTKRCPHPNCRHLLIQPDTKSTRMKIKMVAGNYLPALEVGRRRRVLVDGGPGRTVEEMDIRRKERRRLRSLQEEDEGVNVPLQIGEVLAFTNPLYDVIQIRLTQAKSSQTPDLHLYIPTQHFTVAALKDAWAYEDEDDLDTLAQGSEEASEEGSTASGVKVGSISKRSRMSVLGVGSTRDSKREKGKEVGVEKKGNVSKVGLEVEIMPGAKKGVQETDLEVRYTYRADDAEAGEKKEYKTFTFWVRVNLGRII